METTAPRSIASSGSAIIVEVRPLKLRGMGAPGTQTSPCPCARGTQCAAAAAAPAALPPLRAPPRPFPPGFPALPLGSRGAGASASASAACPWPLGVPAPRTALAAPLEPRRLPLARGASALARNLSRHLELSGVAKSLDGDNGRREAFGVEFRDFGIPYVEDIDENSFLELALFCLSLRGVDDGRASTLGFGTFATTNDGLDCGVTDLFSVARIESPEKSGP